MPFGEMTDVIVLGGTVLAIILFRVSSYIADSLDDDWGDDDGSGDD